MDPDSTHDFDTTVALVRAAQGGDPGALDDLISRYLPLVRHIVALRMGRSLRQIAEVDDAVQEALIRILRGIGSFDHRSEGSFRNWLAKCVRSAVADQARGASRQKRGAGRIQRFSDFDSTLTSSVLAGTQASPSDLARGTELAERIEEALLGMPEGHRELVILRVVCGMSFQEIAVELGISRTGTVRVAFKRVLAKLRERVGVS
jgi:RNA polymerase sigma-70 factor (ECF subfamily)